MTEPTSVMSWLELIWKENLPAYSKYLAAYLRTYMNAKSDMAWPSYSRICQETKLSKSTVAKYLNILDEEGWLERQKGSSIKSTRYSARIPSSVLVEALGSLSNGLSSASHGLGSASHGVRVVRETDTNIQSLNTQSNTTVNLTVPTLDDVVRYFKEKDYSEELANKFYNHYEAIGWVTGKTKTPIKKWKAVVTQWTNREPKENFSLIESIKASFSKYFPDLPVVVNLTETEKRNINKVIKQEKGADTPEFWEWYMAFMSDHKMTKEGFKDWKADFGWLVKPETVIKYIREEA